MAPVSLELSTAAGAIVYACLVAAGIQTPQPESGGHAADRDGWTVGWTGSDDLVDAMQWRERQPEIPARPLESRACLARGSWPLLPLLARRRYEGALRSFPLSFYRMAPSPANVEYTACRSTLYSASSFPPRVPGGPGYSTSGRRLQTDTRLCP
ncbi:hypothetical protein CCMA1212_007116 [Trichoderma ghanense]|uniref:Uncharacterized protein n=1 Tax=Trichoderma ghanense TaxID=65468 RepID=A0ABY2GZ21_9HYPO